MRSVLPDRRRVNGYHVIEGAITEARIGQRDEHGMDGERGSHGQNPEPASARIATLTRLVLSPGGSALRATAAISHPPTTCAIIASISPVLYTVRVAGSDRSHFTSRISGSQISRAVMPSV